MTKTDETPEDQEPQKKPLSLNDIKKYGVPAAMGLGGLFLVVIIAAMLIAKPQGSMMYGICKTFIELHVPYPAYLTMTEVRQFPKAVRIYIMYTDAYGTNKSEEIECSFMMHPTKGAQAEQIFIDREPLEPGVLERFNESVSAIVNAEPDLTLPPRNDGTIKSLKR